MRADQLKRLRLWVSKLIDEHPQSVTLERASSRQLNFDQLMDMSPTAYDKLEKEVELEQEKEMTEGGGELPI